MADQLRKFQVNNTIEDLVAANKVSDARTILDGHRSLFTEHENREFDEWFDFVEDLAGLIFLRPEGRR